MNSYEKTLKRELADFACGMALKAGEIILKRHEGRARKAFDVARKGTRIDLVTSVDREVDAALRKMLDRKYKSHGLVTEESEPRTSSIDIVWYMDPIDGTTNFVHGYPFFCVSIGVRFGGRIVTGVVYDPVRDELFSAVEGGGARLNGKRISVSTRKELGDSLLATGFPYDVKTSKDNNLDYWDGFIRSARALRRDGSAALDLCYVACGRFDGFWETKLKPWDIAAGCLIVMEAGGVATDFSGMPPDLERCEVVASNGAIHEQMLDVIENVRPRRGRK